MNTRRRWCEPPETPPAHAHPTTALHSLASGIERSSPAHKIIRWHSRRLGRSILRMLSKFGGQPKSTHAHGPGVLSTQAMQWHSAQPLLSLALVSLSSPSLRILGPRVSAGCSEKQHQKVNVTGFGNNTHLDDPQPWCGQGTAAVSSYY